MVLKDSHNLFLVMTHTSSGPWLRDTSDNNWISKIIFFLYPLFHTVHQPYNAIDQYWDIYSKAKYTPKQVDYYGAISAMDDSIGKFHNPLQELGIKNNTLFWFTSDNGAKSSWSNKWFTWM